MLSSVRKLVVINYCSINETYFIELCKWIFNQLYLWKIIEVLNYWWVRFYWKSSC